MKEYNRGKPLHKQIYLLYCARRIQRIAAFIPYSASLKTDGALPYQFADDNSRMTITGRAEFHAAKFNGA